MSARPAVHGSPAATRTAARVTLTPAPGPAPVAADAATDREAAPAAVLSPAALLRRLGLHARKRLSQSFLVDRRVAGVIAAAAELDAADTVLEIGPGLGVLTAELLKRASRMVAVELDARLAAELPALLGHPRNLTVVQADALAVDPATLVPPGYKVAANLPYHITSPLLRHLLVPPHRPRRMVVMVQREVAERIAAPVGELSYLAVMVQLFAAPRLVRLVPAGAFYPRPRVESAVLALDVYPAPRVAPEAPEALLRLVQAGFKQPRKQLRNSLAEGLGCPPAEAERLLRQADLDPARRPQTLSLPEWGQLYQVVQRL